jgi:NADPH:quinone reductase-like Zn-dependent oxidoreductase
MDLMQREGQYPLPPQASKTIMGVEFAGTVSKMGEGTSKFKEGDEVFGLASGVSCVSHVQRTEMLLHTLPTSHTDGPLRGRENRG